MLIGEKAVGKTSIVRRFIENSFTTMTESTIGASFSQKVVTVQPKSKEAMVFSED